MLTLIFMRHGKKDHNDNLDPFYVYQIEKTFSLLREEGIEQIDEIDCSPVPRAHDTALLCGKEFNQDVIIKKTLDDAQIAGNGTPEPYYPELMAYGKDKKTVIVVSHEINISMEFRKMSDEDIFLKEAQALIVHFDTDDWSKIMDVGVHDYKHIVHTQPRQLVWG